MALRGLSRIVRPGLGVSRWTTCVIAKRRPARVVARCTPLRRNISRTAALADAEGLSHEGNPVEHGMTYEQWSGIKRFEDVGGGVKMAYIDTGAPPGDAELPVVVCLHGNPTSSWLWRDVIPSVQGVARVVAPDLVGMGHSSEQPDGDYSFAAHAARLDAWFDATGLSTPRKDGGPGVLLVLHDWGSALGFHWARRHAGAVEGIVHGESLVAPVPSWDDFPEGGRDIFKAMRSAAGESIVLEKNVFVERILPSSIQRKLDEREMAGYLARFTEAGETRRPTLTWPRLIPIVQDDTTPADVVEAAEQYCSWVAAASQAGELPMVLLDAQPGFFAPWIRATTEAAGWKQHAVPVKGLHFFQEDDASKVGAVVSAFAMSLAPGIES